jgi:hypothetical protein
MSKSTYKNGARDIIAKSVMTIGGCAISLSMAAAPAVAISNFKWKYRPLIVCATNASDADFIVQRASIEAARTGFKARDVVVVMVIGNTVSSLYGPSPQISAAGLRSRCGSQGSGFRVVLIGKDGGTKRTSNSPLAVGEIFGTIDAMPMRRDEIRRSR